jgi:hypothetical protein
MFYVRDEYLVPATIWALADETSRFWCPGNGFVQDPALVGWPQAGKAFVRSLEVWVLTNVGRIKRGVLVELVNLTEPAATQFWIPANQLTLSTFPMDGVQGDMGISYFGPGFECRWGVGWTLRNPAVVPGEFVEMRIAWEGM